MSLSLILDIFENILFLKILIWVAKLQKEVISKNQLNTLSQGKIDNQKQKKGTLGIAPFGAFLVFT